MKDRIQIEGIWYVKETQPVEIKFLYENIVNSLLCSYEPNNWAFEASVILKDDAVSIKDIYSDPWIEITDKRPANREDWVIDSSDNPNWFRGVLNGSEESMEDANKMFDSEGLAEFRAFIRHLISKGWLSEEENK